MTVLILNSAHGKYPTGSDAWIKATVKAVESFSCDDVTILCSTNPGPWDITTCLAARNHMNVKLIVMNSNNSTGEAEFQHLLEEYNFNSDRTTPLYLGKTPGIIRQKEIWQSRDRLAVKTADVIYPVSIRPDGRLENLLSRENIKAKIRNDFGIPWIPGGYSLRYDLSGRTVNSLPDGEWLVHWTRASQGPWKGEKAWQFYHDLLDNPAVYVRSAFETLLRVLDEERIRGSSWKLPGSECAVSFTALSLEETIPLMRWRKRFVRYTFEPYGIAVRHTTLIDRGARPVRYESCINSDHIDRLFYHAPGIKTDWTREREWRMRGDCPLDMIDDHDLLVLVPDKSEKKAIQKRIHRNISIHTIFSN